MNEDESRKEQFDIREIYTPFSKAQKEIQRRWKDKELRKKIEDYLGGIPKPFKKEPRAVLSRNIITPNLEFMYFLDLVKETGIKPIGLEGIEDKFCTKNCDKVSLAKLAFYDHDIKNKIKNIESAKSVLKIIDIQKSDGKRFCDINTLWGENLVDFHHRMLAIYDAEIELFDDFKWFARNGKRSNPYQYYQNFLALFLCHGILFENFHTKGKEKDFTGGIIIENCRKIMDKFGIKPLIVPLVPVKDEMHLYYWDGYLTKKPPKAFSKK